MELPSMLPSALPPLPFLPPILPLLPRPHGRQTQQTGLNAGLARRTPPTQHQKAAKTAMLTGAVDIADSAVKGIRRRASYPRAAAGSAKSGIPAVGLAWYAYPRVRGPGRIHVA